jgi:hypothetical protein
MVGRHILERKTGITGELSGGLPHTHFVITNIYTMLSSHEDLWWRAKQLEDAGGCGEADRSCTISG